MTTISNTDKQNNTYIRWVAANALAEMIGLGVAGALGALAVVVLQAEGFGFMALMIAGGLFEGLIVGLAQWSVLRRELTPLTWQAWLVPTIAGAGIAWALGMLPSTLMQASEATTGSAPPPDIPDGMMMVIAVGLGIVGGTILGGPQFFTLRRYVHKAGLWIPANAVAWGCAMPLVFLVAGQTPPQPVPVVYFPFLMVVLAVAGAIVGAVHGLMLMVLLNQPK